MQCKKINLTIGVFILFSNFLIARNITGTVTFNGAPMLGVYVQLKDLSIRTITDFDGKYTIEAKEGDVLEFVNLGFKTQEVTIQKSNIINIHLVEDIETLNEVVVVGNGAKSNKGTVISLKSEDIEKVRAVSFEQALRTNCGGVRLKLNKNKACSLSLKAKLFRW